MERGEKEKGVLLRLSEKMRYLFPQTPGKASRAYKHFSVFIEKV
jgi:hypothetical protein